MKIIVVGASGTVGQAVTQALESRHEVIKVGHTHGDYQLDMSVEEQIVKFYNDIGAFDSLVITAGKVHFGLLEQMKAEQWSIGLKNKLMGQVNLVTHGLKFINAGGSFTLTSGIVNKDPIKFGSSAAMVNGALEGFVTSAAIEMPKGVRINIVSPTLLKESAKDYEAYFRGYVPVSASEVAQAYVKSIEGLQNGQIYRVGW
jgi:NAD(P)-dependent dehydrogenase (short-subunit alcohol dehydrogenase family)